ncbi:MAG: hypothetical protein LQ343_005804 [Gyalolechia ehrenbergii]|nr:MAG: hypothetical protein LQ343_005804 [Gyalolechia ehrenbergii]
MAATDCFTQVGDTHTVPANSAQRVSVGIDCPTSERNITCPLQVGGFLKDSPTLNITTDSKDKVFHAVRQATNGTFDDPVIGSVSNFTYPVEPGAMGFYAFTLTLVCYEGTLGDCIGGDVEPGTPVEACEPRTLDGSSTTGFSSFIGDGNFVATAGEFCLFYAVGSTNQYLGLCYRSSHTVAPLLRHYGDFHLNKAGGLKESAGEGIDVVHLREGSADEAGKMLEIVRSFWLTRLFVLHLA